MPYRVRCHHQSRPRVDPLLPAERGGGFDHVRGRVGHDVVETDRARPTARLLRFPQAGAANAFVGDQQHASRAEFSTSPAIFLAAPASKRTLGVVWKVNGFIAGLPRQCLVPDLSPAHA